MKIESNKLINKFMDEENSTIPKIQYDHLSGELLTIEMPRTKWYYHEKWSWLMPVVEKIESIYDEHHGYFGVHISSNGCTIQGTNFRSDIIPEPPVYFNNVVLDTKLNATYYAVVLFIKWYNKNLNK